ncbi:TRL-like family protein [Leptospira sp. 96542]|nr:TRL-like family protein [Leptospira sp. 96542]
MYLRIGILIISFQLFIINCTGYNRITELSPLSNTNPTIEYATQVPVLKGGFFYHKSITPGSFGLNAEPKLEGRACSHSYMYLVATGNSRIETAKQRGEIQKIAYVEYEQMGIFAGYVYHRFCTIVKGSN